MKIQNLLMRSLDAFKRSNGPQPHGGAYQSELITLNLGHKTPPSNVVSIRTRRAISPPPSPAS